MAKQVLAESGEWREGSASPRLLPEEMRRLPGELITRDVDDPDKAHDLDAPHVVSTIVKDFIKAQEPEKDDTPQKVARKLWAPGPGERAPVRQWFVDVVRMRVIATIVNRAVDAINAGIDPDLSPCHLWFETDNVNAYELRRGNPPHRKARPRHLRDIDLVVDMMDPPRSILAELSKRGVDLDVPRLIKETREGQRLVHLA